MKHYRKLNFSPVSDQFMLYEDLVKDLGPADLLALTDGMVDTMLALIADCDDAAVVFVPDDPAANDTFAANEADMGIAWTLGHVIVHTTASAEESAAIAAEMARGVPFHGRSRREVPWQSVTKIAQCRQRLEESRRMRSASLAMWPDQPYLDITRAAFNSLGDINAIGEFVLGLYHDDNHLGQIAAIVRQARGAQAPEGGL